VLAILVGIVLSCGSVRNDELVCEEAVARLENCCPTFDPRRFDCEYIDSCNGGNLPAVDEHAAQCIRDRACGDLGALGICAGLIQLSDEPYPVALRDAIEREACR
jgi:hypothetical protein